jgi:hypothetical protein
MERILKIFFDRSEKHVDGETKELLLEQKQRIMDNLSKLEPANETDEVTEDVLDVWDEFIDDPAKQKECSEEPEKTAEEKLNEFLAENNDATDDDPMDEADRLIEMEDEIEQ